MNCPNCKNPIQDNSTECEWCGNALNSSTLEKIFLVEEIKNKWGFGTLLFGKFNDVTQIEEGDSISYSYHGVISNANIRGIELSGKLISTYKGNQNIIILI